MLTNREYEKRKPLWLALSELWLDSELQEKHLNWIAETMYHSGYSPKELQYIYEQEVAPAVYMNLLTPAGVWSGFDNEWLFKTIISSLESRTSLDKILYKFKKRMMFYATKEHWQYLQMRVTELQKKESADTD